MGGRLVSEGLSLSALSLAGGERQLPCGDDCRKYVVHPDSGSAIHCNVATASDNGEHSEEGKRKLKLESGIQ
jgi:hypothetical protein